MKIEIRIIEDTYESNRINIFEYKHLKKDDTELEKLAMYDFLSKNKNCIITNVDNFLLYALNNCLMAHIIKDNPDIDKSDDYDSLKHIPKLDPKIYRVFEINEDGSEICIQRPEGMIDKNYFNKLMKSIMDDYYSCLNFYY